MNSNTNGGPWEQFRIQLKKTWNELTENDLELISQDRDSLVRIVQSRCRRTPKDAASLSSNDIVRIEQITVAMLQQRANRNNSSEKTDANTNWRQFSRVTFLNQMVGAAHPNVTS